MPAERYFSPSSLELHEHIILEGQELHHMSHVMRAQEEDVIELVNGQGVLAKGRIETLTKREAHIHIMHREERPKDSPSILAVALMRASKLEWIVEKVVELGIGKIWLFPATFSEKEELTETQKLRLKHIAISAMKQCGRLDLPPIQIVSPLKLWEPLPFPIYFGDTRANASLLASIEKEAVFVIGPEKGLTPEEVSHLEQLNAKGVCLHKNILRAETAAIIASYRLVQPL